MKTSENPAGVIIVEDSLALRSALRSVLVHEGYRVLADLADGASLLADIERLQPEIVCLDIGLPGVDGLTLAKKIRTAYPDVAVIVITSSVSDETEQQAVKAGVSAFIRKPFAQAQVIEALRHVTHAQAVISQTRQAETYADMPGGRFVQVVIADDSAAMRQLLVAILTQAGVLVMGEASNGEEAVRLVNDLNPDLVILDYAMPVMNGLEALKRIGQSHPQCKTMMITGSQDRELVRQCALAGAMGYILKPYQPEKVVEAVNRLIAV